MVRAQASPASKSSDLSNIETESRNPTGLVKVEQSDFESKKVDGVLHFHLKPYKERRSKWGETVSVGYSMFDPSLYEPNFIAYNFDEVYSNPSVPLVEFQFTFKRNLSFGSIGMEVGLGGFQAESTDATVDSSLLLVPVRLGFNYTMDTLFSQPYLAPYVSGGAYAIFYRETLAGNSFNGTTQAAPYVAAGVQFQLDWLDKEASRNAYDEAGIQSTFVFLEGRKFFQSLAPADPDFETPFQLGGGLRLEF